MKAITKNFRLGFGSFIDKKLMPFVDPRPEKTNPVMQAEIFDRLNIPCFMAGVVVPNDGHCHLDKHGYYTKSLDQDYPSIALLHQKIKERKANIIFAVTEKNKDLYKQLSDALPDVSSSVGVLADDSRNIVTLIEEEYNKISQKIIMVDNANASQGLRLSYRSKCLE
ncbi:unnamed protein product [Gongylonema pulchrum]|uniref:INB domain-containing protein n=1 Tax=Gongylonema pulchrum TaxID=637853 RepID=A0A183ERJ3_9BILA|nr:unnamed protein product [Gongylonema pulchrum]